MASHHPSSPIEELTSLKHLIEGVLGEVPAGGTRFAENIGTTTDQGLQMPSHLLISRQQFFESVDSQHEELMKGHKTFWDSMISQFTRSSEGLDQGLELASQLSASREQFFQSVESQHEELMKGLAQKHKSVESQHEEMMKGMAQKHKSFWDSMRSQLAEEDRAIAAIKHRQNDALKELQDQDTGLQMTRQTLSPAPSLSWDYREGALRAQHDQLLTKQETLGLLHTSTPVEERTHLEHPIEGVPGGVSSGGTSFHHQEELTELGQDAQSLLMSLDWNHRYRNWDAFSSAEQTPLRHPMQGVSAGVTEPQDSVFQLEAVLQKCHVDKDLQGVSAGTIAPQSSILQHQEAVPSSAHHHEEHSVDDLVVCHPEPDMVTGGQTNLRSSTDAIVELESWGTDDPDPVMDSGASVASPTKATSPPEAARELATHPQSLSKDTTENFTAEQVGDFRPHYQRSPRLLRKENASCQDRKQAKKEFSTQLAGQSGSDDSSGSSSDDHYRRGQRKGRKHQKGSRHPQRATGTSDASLDRNWRQKDNRHTLSSASCPPVTTVADRMDGTLTWSSYYRTQSI